ncbi:hypothetical protein [Photobacterium phosphoreum]|uniref:hypothetical protein n=1 Tax=Photobacterium phosphoreum TaxID=659 RepID=UPI0039AED828
MNKKILLICPKFFGYEYKIKEELVRQGNYVDYIDERPSNSLLYKLILRIGGAGLSNYNFRYYKKNIRNMEEQYDFVFYINIEALDFRTINLLKSNFPNAKHILYMWDSSINKPKYIDLISLFDAVYSFDLKDSTDNNKIEYMPLFSCMKKSAENNKDYMFSFVGTVHSNRFNILMDIKRIASDKGEETYFYLYYPSRILWYLRCLFDHSLKLSDYNKVKFKSLDYIDVENIIKKSHYVIDINHEQQTGFTMRSFEVLCSGSKLLSTNKALLNSVFHRDGMVHYLNPKEIKLPNKYNVINLPEYSDYYLGSWLRKILK